MMVPPQVQVIMDSQTKVLGKICALESYRDNGLYDLPLGRDVQNINISWGEIPTSSLFPGCEDCANPL
jgi:hypothetical protein